MPVISLDQLSLLDVDPVAFARIAHEAGFDAISPLAGGGDNTLTAHCLAMGDPATAAMKAELDARGLAVNNVDGLVVYPEMDWDDVARKVELACYLGAAAGVSLIFDPEPARAMTSFVRVCETAAASGLPMRFEFTPMSQVPTMAAALAYIDEARVEAGLVIDVLHLAYGGESPADIASVPRERIGSAQLCDAPATMTPEQYAHHCVEERFAPGEGGLPVVEFLAALPADVPVGIEAPLTTRQRRGVAPLERARILRQATARALEAARGG